MSTGLTDLSSEVLLRVLSQLDEARDVARIRQVNRRLYALGRDALLWKRLFAHTFLVDPLRRVDVVNTRKRKRLNSNDIEHLPSAQRRPDWYTLFKTSRNWQTGNYHACKLHADTKDSDAGPSRLPSRPKAEQKTVSQGTIVASTPDVIFTAQGVSATGCTGNVHLLAFPATPEAKEGWHDAIARLSLSAYAGAKEFSVSALAVEPSSTNTGRLRLLVTCTDSSLRIVNYDKAQQTFQELSHIVRSCLDDIKLVTTYGNLVATCSLDFTISLYRVEQGGRRLVKIDQTRSHSCKWPASMKLAPSTECESTMCLNMAFVKPTYPSGWTVALQRFDVSAERVVARSSGSAARFAPHVREKKEKKGEHIVSRNAVSSIDRLTSICYEGNLVVVGSRDNSVFCFKVDRSTSNMSVGSSPLHVRHLRTLQGHTGSVLSVSLSDGRCVTGGGDGSVRVWRLNDESAYLTQSFGITSRIHAKFRGGIGNVVTLRVPQTIDHVQASRKRKMKDADRSLSKSLTLSDVLRHHTTNDTDAPLNVIRWVASAFDRIISVSQAPQEAHTCGMEANSGQRPHLEEQVQIWTFS